MQVGHPHLYPMGFAKGTTFMGGVQKAHAREGIPTIVTNGPVPHRASRCRGHAQGGQSFGGQNGVKTRQHRLVARETSPFGVGGDSENESLPSPIRVDRLAWWL